MKEENGKMKLSLIGVFLCSLCYSAVIDTDLLWLRGDANSDDTISISDVIYTSNYLFAGGPAPICMEAADANTDGSVNNSDIVFTINYLVNGGSAPAPAIVECE